MFNDENWQSFLKELVDAEAIDVSSLKLKNKLSEDFWENEKLKPEIADSLYAIAKEFFQTLQLDPSVLLKDVTLTGSLATFNWSDMSDADVHLILDFTQFDDVDLMQDYFRQKVRNWNSIHKIMAKGHEVEIYVQDSNEPHYADGVYSISEDQWLKTPKRYRGDIDYESVKKKAADLMNQIDDVYEYYAERDYKMAHEAAEGLMDRIKKYRRIGLATDGTNSIENLAFKVLRRNGYIKKLSSLKILSYDKMMSINY